MEKWDRRICFAIMSIAVLAIFAVVGIMGTFAFGQTGGFRLKDKPDLSPTGSEYLYTDSASIGVRRLSINALQGWLGTPINVKQYGAKGDGATDDTAAIQAAINKCAAARQKLVFPTGVYLVSSSLVIPSFAYISGTPNFDAASAGTVIKAATGFTGDIITDLSTNFQYSIIIENITIDGNNGASGSGIHFGVNTSYGCFWTIIRNVTVTHVGGHGIWLYGGTTITLENVVVEYPGEDAIMINGGFNHRLRDITTEWIPINSVGIHATGTHSLTVDDFYVEHAVTSGVYLDGSTTDTTIKGTWISSAYYGITVDASNNTTLINCQGSNALNITSNATSVVVINPDFSSILNSSPSSAIIKGSGIQVSGTPLVVGSTSGALQLGPSNTNIASDGTALYLNTTGNVYFGQADSAHVSNAGMGTFSGISVGTGSINIPNMLISPAAPTISSGFGTSPSIVKNNGAAAFTVNVGTGGTATSGVIGLPTAANGWNCFCNDLTTFTGAVFLCRQTATSAASATIGNFNSSAAAAPWGSGDVVRVSCFAY